MIFLLTVFLFLQNSFSYEWKSVDAIVSEAIKEKVMPGGVLVIGKGDDLLFQKSFGSVASGESALETIYDIASLTKVVGTATSIMILEERGKLSLSDKLSKFFPEFSGGDKDLVSLEHLLRHESGLPSGKSTLSSETFEDYILRVLSGPLSYSPGKKTVYSDLGFILLAEVVKKVSGENLSSFTWQNIFSPLKMNSTFFHVPTELMSQVARTFPSRQGVPHDPTAYVFYPHELGHAGIFTNSSDLTRLVQMYVNLGSLDGVTILKPETVLKMTKIKPSQIRGLGWDLLSEYSPAPRGEVFPSGTSYGHTGYTGTTIWIDPVNRSFYLFLSNRVLLGDAETKAKFSAFRKKLSTAIGKQFYQK